MTDKELMQQALKKLEFFANMKSVSEDTRRLITDLRERLAQPEQQDSTCNNTLRAQGKGYPRTCRKCGFGPCIADREV